MVFLWDPCGLLCIVFTYAIVIYADYVVLFHLIRPVLTNGFAAVANAIAFNIIAFLLGFSHLCAVFSNPGFVPPGKYSASDNQKPQDWTLCTRCSMFRPPRAHHCRVCRRCVRRMDHHCPWINNCVGEYNQKYFILFLIYVGILCVYSLIMVVVCRAVMTTDTDKLKQDNASIVVAHTVILVAICCLFGLFVLAIFSDQFKSIIDDETAIEALQNRRTPQRSSDDVDVEFAGRRRRSKWAHFQQVFGNGPVYLWLLPCYHILRSSPPMEHSFPSETNQSCPMLSNMPDDVSTDSSSL